MPHRIFRAIDEIGDMGGYFYALNNMHYGYANVVRVVPCADADAPANCYWVELVTVNIPSDTRRLQAALDCCGVTELPKGAARNHVLVDCCLTYGYFDKDASYTVQIGAKPLPAHESVQPDIVLRGNANIVRWAYSKALAYCS